MVWRRDGAELLLGPWGRRLCVEILADALLLPNSRPNAAWRWKCGAALTRAISRELTELVAGSELERVSGCRDPAAFWRPLADTVAASAYWQPLGDLDRALTQAGIADELLPVAAAVAASPACEWWDSPIALDAQCRVLFDGMSSPERDSATALEAWQTETLDDERRAADRPKDPSAP